MAHVTRWLIPAYALGAFLVAVFLIPSVGWAPREHLDVLRGNWRMNGSFGFPPDTIITPAVLGPTPSDTGTDDDTVLLKILDSRPTSFSSNPTATNWDANMKELGAFCIGKGTKEYLALFLRFASFACIVPRPHAESVGPPPDRTATLGIVLTACAAGERIDSDNAYFTLIEAGARFNLGNHRAAVAAFRRSAELTRVDEYMQLEADIRHRWLIRHRGYQGNQMDAWITASLELPHFAAVRSIVRTLAFQGGAADRIVAMRIGDLLIRRSATVIGFLVGRSIIASALEGAADQSSGHDPDAGQAAELVKPLQASAHGVDLGRILQRYAASHARLPDSVWDVRENLIESNRAAFGASVLLAIFLFPVFLGWGWLCARFDRLCAMSPYLIWLLAMPLAQLDSGTLGQSLALLVAGVLLGLAALFPKARRVVDAVGIAWSALAIYLGLFVPQMMVVPIFFLVALALERRAERPLWWVTGVTVMTALFTAALYWTFNTVHYGPWQAGPFVALVGCMGLVRARRSVRWEPVAGMVSFVLVCAYGFCLNRELSANRALVNFVPAWMHEADAYRLQLHIS
ncbi:MAG: hypothetical protein ACYC96_02810 [Fimbriimonadaceae bacterium]